MFLVTGGSGFVGSNLALRLANEGNKVRATYLNRKDAVPQHENIIPLQMDLTNPEDCMTAVEGVEKVFMCAAQTHGAAVIKSSPLSHVTPNVLMNTLVLDAAYKAGVQRFVFISTGAVYPDVKGRPVSEHEVLDGPPYDAYFAAGWMKRYTEILCETYARKIAKPMSCVVVRPSNIYGPNDKFSTRTSHVTAANIRKVFEQKIPLELWGSGEDVRDVIYIDDFVEGLIAASKTEEQFLDVNIASGVGVSVREILETAMKVSGHHAKIQTDPTKPSTIPILLFDVSKAKTKLGFQARTRLEDGIQNTLTWLETTPKSRWDR